MSPMKQHSQRECLEAAGRWHVQGNRSSREATGMVTVCRACSRYGCHQIRGVNNEWMEERYGEREAVARRAPSATHFSCSRIACGRSSEVQAVREAGRRCSQIAILMPPRATSPPVPATRRCCLPAMLSIRLPVFRHRGGMVYYMDVLNPISRRKQRTRCRAGMVYIRHGRRLCCIRQAPGSKAVPPCRAEWQRQRSAMQAEALRVASFHPAQSRRGKLT